MTSGLRKIPSLEMETVAPADLVFTKFRKNKMSLIGLWGFALLFLVACSAPLIANPRPLLIYQCGSLSSPALRYIFAPDSSELIVEKTFNMLLLLFPMSVFCLMVFKGVTARLVFFSSSLLILIIPFILVNAKLDKADWKEYCANLKEGEFAIFAPIRFGPYENVSKPFILPDRRHLFGTDQNGRDVLSRMIYGARVSLAVGILATLMTMIIGIAIGMIAGYFGRNTDIVIMRIVEIIMCFPTFLLLLILMVIMMDRNFKQSIVLVILVIGLTSWTGLCRIVRGEVLKERSLAYIKSCESLGLPVWRIMFFHLLPNIMGPILVSFTFGVAGAVLAESSLSFLGFGVQPPTASWGELLRESLSNPLQNWHLTLWPGLAIFITVVSFNFMGEGLKKAYQPQD